MYKITTQQFTGPFEKLLELIEEEKLEITTVSLAAVTGDFLKYLDKMEHIEPSLLADFLAVASRLLLIKSQSLLPDLKLDQETEKDIHNLEEQLRLYKEIRAASRLLVKEEKVKMFARSLFLNRPSFFCPSRNIQLNDLWRLIQEVAEMTAKLNELDVKAIKIVTISLERKIKDVLNRLSQESSWKFSSSAQGSDRSEIIVLFLAILHLLKEKIINVRQEKHFEEITIEKPPL